MICAYIDAYRDRFGVEPICRVLAGKVGYRIAPSTYYAFKARPPSQRSVDDVRLVELIRETFVANFSCYGAVKLCGNYVGRAWTSVGTGWRA